MPSVKMHSWVKLVRQAMALLVAVAVSAGLAPVGGASARDPSISAPTPGCCDLPAPAPCAGLKSACAALCAPSHASSLDYAQISVGSPAAADTRVALRIRSAVPALALGAEHSPDAGPPAYLRFGRLLL